VLGTRPQELRVLRIEPKTVGRRHPLISIRDTMFEFVNSSRRVVADTTQLQLRVISVGMIIHAVLVDLLFKISGVHNKQPRAEYRSLWYGARDVNSARHTAVVNNSKCPVTQIRLEPL